MDIKPDASFRRDLTLLFVAIGLIFCIGLGARPYLTPSEARYIELPRQMLTTHDWLTPRINGVPYFEKPPLFYWMQAAVIGVFGEEEFAGRIVTALLTTLTCLATYATGRMLYGRLSGFLAAMILATSLMGYGLSRVATLDVPVSLFITACLACFLAAQQTGKRNFYWLMYVASALAMMTKGLIGMVIPGMVIGAWIALTRRWQVIAQARLIPGLILFLAIAAPWHVLMAKAHPDFLNFYFIHEHFTRYLTDEHKRTAPWWFFIAVTVGGLMPWTALLPGAIRRMDWKKREELFLLLWIFLPLIFFSTSHSKLLPYIFPIFPPLCIAMGNKLALLWKGDLPIKSLRMDAWFVVVIFALLLAGGKTIPALSGKLGAKMAIFTDGISVLMLLPIVIALAFLVFTILSKRGASALIMSLMGFGVVTGVSANYMAASLDKATVKPLTMSLLQRLKPEDKVVAYESYWQDLPVYLDRNITVAGWTGELSFGVEHYPATHEWMISSQKFWWDCAESLQTVYVFMNKTSLDSLSQLHTGIYSQGPTAPKEELPSLHNVLNDKPATCQLRVIGEYGKTVLLERITP